MSNLVTSSSQYIAATDEANRRSANYTPSIWGDRFLAPHSPKVDEKQFQQLKEEVRMMLIATVDKPSTEKLRLIDALQSLGVAYHFENEIDEMLQHIHKKYKDNDVDDHHDLYTTALCFRLLRQQGYDIPCDVFKKFKDNQGKFKESLINDVQGMLSLYEASHLRVHGEDILDEAHNFTTTHLQSMQTQLSPPLSEHVAHALKQPIHRALTRVRARPCISSYQQDASRSEVLLSFAKLDFNMLQKLHHKELSEISGWWKDLDFKTKLPFARDRIVECYFWILGVYYEPQYSLARRILTKVISMTSIIDDIFDVHGTYEELQSFTQAVERWDISCIHQLPECMTYCYRALLEVYDNIEKEMAKEGRTYRADYAKEAMKIQVGSYFVEAKWCNENYIPTMEEYMQTALLSCGYFLLTTTSFVGMGDIVTKEAFDWVFRDPKIVKAASTVNRLMDDIVSTEFEQKRGHVASGIHCYMKEHDGVSEDEVCELFNRQIVDAWKDINQELLRPTQVPMPLLTRVLNLARVMDLLYRDEDSYTHVGKVLRDGITSLLIDPMA
ncbi:hypothetical protein FNV43_RR01422 [Rhamnella rubrinervis]|uniref:Sesquiterpene synthase n=1 Tax=Rhamnella rubrinervis TaxID=2594499 RepID=A0A8K0HRF8_9ROSA|nr:hypothetical protein FNV43_RR01422 [Rhamnella rubrinervis]